LKSFPTLFIYKKQWNQFEKTLNWKTTKHKPLKKENSFYYQTFTKFVGHLNFITDFRASSSILEFHAWLFLFYVTFKQFAVFYKNVLTVICCKEKLKRSKATLSFSFHFDFASTLFFFAPKVKFVFPTRKFELFSFCCFVTIT
jgi:hypothetical protein